MKRKLYKFHGGIEVADFKSLSTESPLRTIPAPEVLIMPLRQHIGAPAKPCVEAGQKVKKYEVIARPAKTGLSSTIHSPVSGRISAIKNHPLIHQSGLEDTCIFIENDNKYETITPDINHDPEGLSQNKILEKIQAAGIVGLGGAGFPSEIKALGGIKNKISTLIINGAECEPYISCDDLLMQTEALNIIKGIKIIDKLIAPDNIVIALEDNKPKALAALTAANLNPKIEVVSIPTIYPSGGERQLIKILTNKEIRAGTIPADIGVLCFNVSTVFAMYEAVVKDKPLTERLVTLTGDKCEKDKPLTERLVTLTGDKCENAGNYHITIGTPISHIAKYFEFKPDREIICGGPMMGFQVKSLDAPVSKTTNCLIVMESAADRKAPQEPCIRCGRCVEVCPARLLPQQLYWYCRDKDFTNAQNYDLVNCIECNCCTHVCPSNIPLVAYYQYAKTQIRSLDSKRKKAEHAKMRHDMRESRLERLKQERLAKRQKQKQSMQKKMAADKSSKDDKAKIIAKAQSRVKREKDAS